MSEEVIEIVVDDREEHLHAALRAIDTTDFKLHKKRLKVGDVLIQTKVKDTVNIRVVLERKRMDDLLNSVFDGRLKRQMTAMNEMCVTTQAEVVLLLEGDIEWHIRRRVAQRQRQQQHACTETAMYNLIYSRMLDVLRGDDHVYVIQTPSVTTSALLLHRYARKFRSCVQQTEPVVSRFEGALRSRVNENDITSPSREGNVK